VIQVELTASLGGVSRPSTASRPFSPRIGTPPGGRPAVPPIGTAATRGDADLPAQAGELLSRTLDGSACSAIRRARLGCCNVNSGTAERRPRKAETVRAVYPLGCLTPSRAIAPDTIGPVRTIELPAVFEQSAAPLMPTATADVTTPCDDDGDVVRHAGRLRQWPQLQIPVPGKAGTGKLP